MAEDEVRESGADGSAPMPLAPARAPVDPAVPPVRGVARRLVARFALVAFGLYHLPLFLNNYPSLGGGSRTARSAG